MSDIDIQRAFDAGQAQARETRLTRRGADRTKALQVELQDYPERGRMAPGMRERALANMRAFAAAAEAREVLCEMLGLVPATHEDGRAAA